MKKRYGKKDKWIRISYSKPYRIRKAIKVAQASCFLACVHAKMRQIQYSNRPDAVIGIALCAIEAATGIAKFLNDDFNEVSKC